MADWKSIPDTDVDPDAPVTSELMYALRDNPIAIAEGATGAPRVIYPAINGVVRFGITDNNYVITNLRSRLLLIGGSCSIVGSGQTISVYSEFSQDGGSTWFGTVMIGSAVNSSSSSINYIMGSSNVNINAVRFRYTSTGGTPSYNLFVASIGSVTS